MNNQNLISIIIVNWNGQIYLKRCLDSLFNQTYKNFEIIFVDNASTDDSVEFVRKNYPQAIIVQNKENMGFAGGNNRGVKRARGEYVLFLNNDTWADENYLENFIKAFWEIPKLGCAQSKIVLAEQQGKIDGCGAFWTDYSILYNYGCFKDASLPIYNKPMPIFSAIGASMLIKKDIIDKIGLFDDDFWCYYEETDFCHRVWLAGYECWYYPKTKIYHIKGATSVKFKNALIQYHNFKNKLLSILKNFQMRTLIKVLPVFLILSVGVSFLWLFSGKVKHFLSIYKAFFWNIRNFPSTMEKRRKIKKFRKIKDAEYLKLVKHTPPLYYYYYFIKYKDPGRCVDGPV